MEFIIDHREKDLSVIITDIPYKKENLELGDFIWKYQGSIVLLFERKTFSDLAASIKDGRYHNQKKRLLETYPSTKLAYVIEGAGDFTDSDFILINGISKKTLLSCVYNTILRDRIMVFRSTSLLDTVELIRGINIRFDQDPDKYINHNNETIEHIIKINVKTPQEYFIRALCQVPGVSQKTAKAIACKYSTFADFFKNANEQALKDIMTIDSKGAKRRISTTIVKNLVDFLLQN